MIDVRNIYSLSDFVRNTKSHVQRPKDSKAPEVLTVNGRAELVVQDAESYQAMLDELERARFIESLVAAERDYEAGKGRPSSSRKQKPTMAFRFRLDSASPSGSGCRRVRRLYVATDSSQAAREWLEGLKTETGALAEMPLRFARIPEHGRFRYDYRPSPKRAR
jgi:hypothetical protein